VAAWTDAEQCALAKTRRRFVEALESAGYGHVRVREAAVPDPNPHHHLGTTRMHDDPRVGVVDANCRVHSVENLFVAGASVFPTAGFANPMLTIVALAAKLGDRLARDYSDRHCV
jgi:choline dehydrogenase-like flavoprotein